MTNTPEILVTGGTGFVGSSLVRALVAQFGRVRVLDNGFRGKIDSLADIEDSLELVIADIRSYSDVRAAMDDIKIVYHLAYINGTENFYKMPKLVLDTAIRGQLNALDAADDANVETFIYASSSEVYQTPSILPTPEEVPMVIPDSKNPRYSYGGGKAISELLLLHYADSRKFRRIIFRPHNVYGPCMGFKHVIPQLIEKIFVASERLSKNSASVTIQGTGAETRAFCYIDDAVDGILLAAAKGDDGEIYHLGVNEEISISALCSKISEQMKIDVNFKPSSLSEGATNRRCPDISKLRRLGYSPKISLSQGLEATIPWYVDFFK